MSVRIAVAFGWTEASLRSSTFMRTARDTAVTGPGQGGATRDTTHTSNKVRLRCPACHEGLAVQAIGLVDVDVCRGCAAACGLTAVNFRQRLRRCLPTPILMWRDAIRGWIK